MHSVPSAMTQFSFLLVLAFCKQCMSRPLGVTYMAGKKHYFGVGGGTRRFLSLVEKDGKSWKIEHLD